jgi:tRNA-dependent cyclodipeptide synthase
MIRNKMKLYSIHGGTEQELINKAYNIGVGVSLGNKWFTIENTLEIIKWALSYTKEHVVVYVADSIHAINIQVRSDKSFEVASKRTIRQGRELLDSIQSEVEKIFTPADSSRIFYTQWRDLETEAYKAKVKIVYDFYENNADFRNLIERIVREYVSKEERKFNDAQIHRFGMYCVEELPEMINRVPIGGRSCDACVYPYISKLNLLVEDIQNGIQFPELKQAIMDTAPKVFLEVR